MHGIRDAQRAGECTKTFHVDREVIVPDEMEIRIRCMMGAVIRKGLDDVLMTLVRYDSTDEKNVSPGREAPEHLWVGDGAHEIFEIGLNRHDGNVTVAEGLHLAAVEVLVCGRPVPLGAGIGQMLPAEPQTSLHGRVGEETLCRN